ncbi:MAG TPA: division/cell wall cluster transcriptional repressor MraZ [Candidatus Limnocylindrales bacterium]|nr:division/cell wall cluster transcriptional repressor MraZ [Candidatus Limnocylindrales bacterium]
MFTGEYRHTIDAKGRIAVPARFRADLAGVAYVSRWMDGCLAIFPRDAWNELAQRVAGLQVSNASARSFARFLFGGAFEVEPDRQGRVVLPAALRAEAALNGEAVVVGMRDHLEIWQPERWAAYGSGMSDPEVFAAHIQGLGI